MNKIIFLILLLPTLLMGQVEGLIQIDTIFNPVTVRFWVEETNQSDTDIINILAENPYYTHQVIRVKEEVPTEIVEANTPILPVKVQNTVITLSNRQCKCKKRKKKPTRFKYRKRKARKYTGKCFIF